MTHAADPMPDPAAGVPGGDGAPAPTTGTTTDNVFEVQHVTKRFGAVVALSDVNLRLGRGRVHCKTKAGVLSATLPA